MSDFEGTLNISIKAVLTLTYSLPGFPDIRWKEWVTVEPMMIKRQFCINPDPWTLWKELPTPNDAPYQKNDTDEFSGMIADGDKAVFAASQRGRSHAHEGRFRDDHFSCQMSKDENGWNIFAVADGAGSAKYSREGAKIACESVTKELFTKLEDPGISSKIDDIIKNVDEQRNTEKVGEFGEISVESEDMSNIFHTSLYNAWMAINKESQTIEHGSIKDYSTTLMCIAIKKYDDFWAIASYWVGDGGLAIYQPNGRDDVLPLGVPDGGEYAGQTKFFTMKEEIDADSIKRRLRFFLLNDFKSIILMTDGITDPYFPAESNLSDINYWTEFWKKTLLTEFPGFFEADTIEKKAKALLSGLNFKIAGNHDDRTLMIIMNPNRIIEKA